MNETITTLAVLVTIAIGSGTGGIVGAVVMIRRFKIEQEDAKTKRQVDLQSVDVEHFKAMFPGGLGDAVEHWRDEAKKLYDEVDELRETESENHDEIIRLKSELAATKLELAQTKRDLERSDRRIEQLEAERDRHGSNE